MAERTVEEQLTKYLTDVHSIEDQALAQLEAAPAGFAFAFEHLEIGAYELLARTARRA